MSRLCDSLCRHGVIPPGPSHGLEVGNSVAQTRSSQMLPWCQCLLMHRNRYTSNNHLVLPISMALISHVLATRSALGDNDSYQIASYVKVKRWPRCSIAHRRRLMHQRKMGEMKWAMSSSRSRERGTHRTRQTASDSLSSVHSPDFTLSA